LRIRGDVHFGVGISWGLGQRVSLGEVVAQSRARRSTWLAPRCLDEDLRAAGGNVSVAQWAGLEDLLQKSGVESPLLAAPRLALANCLRQQARYLEAQTAPDMVNAQALRARAENLLREAVAAEPHLPAPRLAVAEFLLESLRYVEAETVAAAAVRCCPAS